MKPSSIRVIHLELCYTCNHHCAFCPQEYNRSVMLPHGIIEALSPCFDNLRHLILTGGEAFLWPHIKELVEHILEKSPEVKCSAVTNGSILTPYWKDLVNRSFFRKFNISFNAVNREMYKKIHGKDHFQKVLANVEFLSEYRKNIKKAESPVKEKSFKERHPILNKLIGKSRKEQQELDRMIQGFELAVSCVFSRVFLGQLKDFTRLFAGKVDKIIFQELSSYPEIIDYYDKQHITDDMWPQFEEEFRECSEIAAGLSTELQVLSNRHLQLPDAETTGESCKSIRSTAQKTCILPWTQIIINAKGEVRLGCCNSRHIVGDIKKASIKEILNNPSINRIQKKIIKSKFEFCPEPRLRHKCPCVK